MSNNLTLLDTREFPIRPLFIHDGTVELLKWIALSSMFIDHFNRYLFHYDQPWMLHLGRLAMPLFFFVLAYNLSRGMQFNQGRAFKMMKKMAFFGVISTPIILLLNEHAGHAVKLLPLNIMFSLVLTVAAIYTIETKNYGWKFDIALLSVCAMFLTDYEIFSLIFGCISYLYIKQPTKINKALLVLATALLILPGTSPFVLAAIPFMLYADKFVFTVERSKDLFYWAYPLHLAVLLIGISFSKHML